MDDHHHELMERVALKTAEETVRLAKAEIRMEMLEMRHTLITDLNLTIDRKFERSLGMPATEHVVAHKQISEFIDEAADIRKTVTKTVLQYFAAGAISAAVAVYYSSNDASPAIKPIDSKQWQEWQQQFDHNHDDE